MRIGMVMATGVVAVSGCSIVSGTPTVSQDDLESRVTKSITPDEPGAAVSADCAGPLEGETGSTQTCHVKVGEQEADVRLKVTRVEGDEVHWSTDAYLPPDVTGAAIAKDLQAQGIAVDSVDCRGELAGTVGDTTTCGTTGSGAPGDLTVKVTSVDGLMINFSYTSD